MLIFINVRNHIRKILREESEKNPLEWVNDILGPEMDYKLVIVTHTGYHYSNHLKAMASLGVPKAENYWNETIERVNNNGERKDNLCREYTNKLREEGILGPPKNGDICYLMPNEYLHEHGDENIRHLVRISDGKHFIIDERGFKPYELPSITESEEFDWVEDVKDNLNYLKVGQKFIADSRVIPGEKVEMVITKIVGEKIYVKPQSMPEPYKGIVFTTSRLLELINKGEFVPSNTIREQEEVEFGWVKDILKNLTLPYGYAISICNVEGNRKEIERQVFEKLKGGGYDTETLDLFINRPPWGGRTGVIIYLGSNYKGNKNNNWQKHIEWDYCNMIKSFGEDGVQRRENKMWVDNIPEYKLIDYKDFLDL